MLEKHFPMNYSSFDPGRVSRGGRFGRLLIQAYDNGTLLREHVWNQILFVDELVRNVTFEHKGSIVTYDDVCAQWNGVCWQNEILGLGRYMQDIASGELPVTYPIWFDPETFQRHTFPFFTGGITLTEDHTIANMAKLSLNYFLKSATKEEVSL